MDHTGSSDRRLTFFIVHGFSGGRLHSTDLRKQLKLSGYLEARSMGEADVVIAHSAGYYLLTEHLRAKIIMLVGPPLPQNDYGRAYRQANLGMWRESRANKYLLKRMLWSLYSSGYLVTRPKHNHRLASLVKGGDRNFRPPRGPQIILIANQEDPWPKSELMQEFIVDEPWAFLSLPGSHEHIKKDPAAYIAIINYYAKQFLA